MWPDQLGFGAVTGKQPQCLNSNRLAGTSLASHGVEAGTKGDIGSTNKDKVLYPQPAQHGLKIMGLGRR